MSTVQNQFHQYSVSYLAFCKCNWSFACTLTHTHTHTHTHTDTHMKISANEGFIVEKKTNIVERSAARPLTP